MIGHTVGKKCPEVRKFIKSEEDFAKENNLNFLIKMIGMRSGKRSIGHKNQMSKSLTMLSMVILQRGQ